MPMNKITTHDQLLRYIYNETSSEENKEIKLQLLLDAKLYEELQDFKAIKKNLDICILSPKASTINKIMAYAA
jgi:hypothetical protein